MTGIDPAEVGREAMALMDQLMVNRLPEGARIEEVMVIAAITFPTGNTEEAGSDLYYRCTSAFPWVQKGIAAHLFDAIRHNSQPWRPE
jgi:hypothetical protein